MHSTVPPAIFIYLNFCRISINNSIHVYSSKNLTDKRLYINIFTRQLAYLVASLAYSVIIWLIFGSKIVVDMYLVGEKREHRVSNKVYYKLNKLELFADILRIRDLKQDFINKNYLEKVFLE